VPMSSITPVRAAFLSCSATVGGSGRPLEKDHLASNHAVHVTVNRLDA
jgi:hypothetical protein